MGAGDAVPARPRLIIVPSACARMPLDPSLARPQVGAKAGFDLTWPFGSGGTLRMASPEPPRFEGERFASLRAALGDGPKRFEELMAALGSRDGREIVRELEGCAPRA